MKYSILLISILLTCIKVIYGQEMDKSLFSGIVLNSDSSKNSIPQTNIYLKNGMGTSTHVNGKFAINVVNGDSLTFSHIGFRSKVVESEIQQL